MRFLLWGVLGAVLGGASLLVSADLVPAVRARIAQHDLKGAEGLVRESPAQTPETLLALSWLGRGALAEGKLNLADSYAKETRDGVAVYLKQHKLDDEKQVPLALGASIEVQAQVLAARGDRNDAIAYVEKQIGAYRHTSIVTRLRKNLNLLSLAGKPAPALVFAEHLGPPPPSLKSLRGKPVLLFFWAHWCGDCKQQVAVLARVQKEFGPRGLALIGPTQRFGYAAGGEDATPAAEFAYIEKIRQQYYAPLAQMPVPVSAELYKTYGASTTPTLVLVDGKGIVRFYHPGQMSYDDLAAQLKPVL